jgi:hypothetical protein
MTAIKYLSMCYIRNKEGRGSVKTEKEVGRIYQWG